MTAALPANIFCARDYETLARERLDAGVFAHLAGGSGVERAVAANRDAFDAVTITPRILRDLSAGSTAASLAGHATPHPIWLAPVAFQALFHQGAELETARAADAVGAGMVASTLSSLPLEALTQGAVSPRWFQLYVQPSREATLDLVRRAEAAGYSAIVLTVDAAVKAVGPSSLRAGFRGSEEAANFAGYDLSQPPLAPGDSRVFQGLMRTAPTWDDIAWLRDQTRLPLWLKGVLHPDDAKAAAQAGCAGVIVSNHGGRSLDAAPASLAALSAIRAAMGQAYPLMVDGGIRSGEDVFAAIALGADSVLIGRLQACALAVAGALGVAHMVRLLREELEVAMAQAGCASLADIRKAQVVMKGQG